MKISVAMCTYNGESYVQEQLNSIAAQTRLPDELVICDDRSTDHTREVVERFSYTSPFPVRVFSNDRNLGSTKNFERAIGQCGGDVIALSDQDDVWRRDKLERIQTAFLSSPTAGLVFTDGDVVDESLRPLGYSLWDCFGFTSKRQTQFARRRQLEVFTVTNVSTGATMAFRSEFKPLVLPIPADNGLLHDGWIALLIAAVADLAFIPEPLIRYRRHSSQQVGATMFGSRQLFRRVLESEPASHLRVASDFRQAYERLLGTRDRCTEEGLALLQEKITHSQARGSMPRGRILRLPSVLRETLTFRYHRYSSGLYSAAKDLLL
jgi:glycosyltransferase involved in cell wall biosynthesis